MIVVAFSGRDFLLNLSQSFGGLNRISDRLTSALSVEDIIFAAGFSPRCGVWRVSTIHLDGSMPLNDDDRR